MKQMWHLSHRCDTEPRKIADRHYNRQHIGADNFVPPGKCLVLKTAGAVWVTSWPIAEYVKHAWAGAFINSLFRKEVPGIASEYITMACAATRACWPELPKLGMVTFIDPNEVAPRKVRGKLCIGISYFEAGFVHVGYTKAGLWAMQLTPEKFPVADMAIGATACMFDEVV